MVVWLSRKRGSLRRALGGLENRKLRLGDGLAVLVEPSQGVVAVGRVDVGEHTLRLAGRWRMRACGEDDVGQIRYRLLQRGITIYGVLPDLVGIRAKVDLSVGIAVENAGLLGE